MATRSRTVLINQVVYDQADFFQADGSTRQESLVTTDLTYAIFFKNVPQSWVLVDGSSVLDSQVRSGSIYFNEMPGSPGYYNVRFRPNALGYWRLLLTWAGPDVQIVAQDYDVVEQTLAASGLKSSFTKDC